MITSSTAISAGVNATSGGAFGVARLAIVSQNTRHPTTPSTASKLVSRAVVGSFDCSVHRRADEEVRPGRVSRVKQLEDVAPAVANVDAPRGITEFLGGPRHVHQPPVTLLLLDRDGRRVDHPLAGVGPLKTLAGPELDGH